MRYLAGIAAVLLLLLAVLLGPTLQDALEARNDYQQQRRAIALERERLALEQARQWAPYTAPADLVFTWVIRLGILGALGVMGWGAVDAYRQRKASHATTGCLFGALPSNMTYA
jgi:type II secretory pathway pseudopilin PulG